MCMCGFDKILQVAAMTCCQSFCMSIKVANILLSTEYGLTKNPHIVGQGTLISNNCILVIDTIWNTLYSSEDEKMMSFATPRSFLVMLDSDKLYAVADWLESDSLCLETQKELQELGVTLNSNSIVLKLGRQLELFQ